MANAMEQTVGEITSRRVELIENFGNIEVHLFDGPGAMKHNLLVKGCDAYMYHRVSQIARHWNQEGVVKEL